MLISVLKSKISYATVSGKDLFYVGSVTTDSEIMKQINIIENEKVQVINVNNGERLETYVIKGQANSKTIVLNSQAAIKYEIGDQLFIITYAQIDLTKESIKPKIVDLKTGE
ncbi:aspartate 1-decarboxylase [Francisella endosymbiont of Amblyomma maculatum]|nr:aspartate 1-decarboxylase [Francisella endosymbiont of Amblyomma maculatum]